jgi:general secretion pathway protein J
MGLRRKNSGGFTLVEVMVASVIGAFIALIAVGALRAVSGGAERIDTNIDIAAEVRFAANLVSRDLRNLYRDRSVENMRFVGELLQSPAGTVSRLVFYTVGRVKARADEAEGDVYEVEYCLQQSRDDEQTLLFRRLWPNPEKEAEPGGVLTPVAENIGVFGVRYYDGEQWQLEWPEKMESIPRLVEVTIAARGETGDAVTDTFLVSFARRGWREEMEDAGEESAEGQEGEGEER